MSRTKSIRPKTDTPFPTQEIRLENPVRDSFEQFIVYNSIAWQTRAIVEIESVLEPEIYEELKAEMFKHRPGMAFGESKLFHDFIEPFAQKHYMVEQGSGKGKHLILCGAGPSLKEHADEWCKQGDEIWGCNSAVTWLADNGYNPTHAFTIDQTAQMYLEWKDAPDDIEYLVATTIHPFLADLLIDRGRKFRYFNNYNGIRRPPVKWPDENGVDRILPYEEWMYALLFPATIQCGSGLNAVTRALDIAAYMDFDKVTVLGADCSIDTNGKQPPKHLQVGSPQHKKWLRKNTVMHVDGGNALASESTAMTMQATIDGRFWLTKPDLALSAQWLVKMAKASGGKIQLIGDGLPNALYDKDEDFWARMPNMAGSTVTP